ncbi:sugar ABC transporter permease [Brooklawnia cerclae]|uniref:Raffinose/stachyose/melibiose transport system permease protein n=1 Tax=Brooklawnia cerclae TaxID=349934 RepID=A0ABX0SBV7_9ACTN|nr:sugar ABC transporter permease [Brooklawnia cerclae]NIH55409.1 raffinose/stachyose/melibiose transport system permease protein [Brooklawnia cerclae]
MKRTLIRWGWLFTGPTLIAFMIGFVVPFVLGVYLSFTRFTTVTNSTWVGFDNYLGVFADGTFVHSLWYTAAFAIVTTVVINVAAFAVAYMLVKAFRGANLFRSVFFMPNLIGGIVLGYIWMLLLNGLLGIWARSITFSATYGFWGMVALMCWQQIGYMMVIYIAGLQSIPGELIESAEMDGASRSQTLWNIIIPLVMPSITVCTFLTITNGFKMFDQNLALTNGAPSRLSELLALNIYNTFYARTGFEGVGQAKAVVFLLIVAVIALIQNRLARSKETQA